MSISARKLTNLSETKTIYKFTNRGVDPTDIQLFSSFENIPDDIKQYFLKDNASTKCGPDMASFFGVLSEFYPEHSKYYCAWDGLKPNNTKQCIAENCRFVSKLDGNWRECPWYKLKED
jgi:hypothetical protein